MQEKAELSEVKIFRFDPSVDKEPKYETYQVPYNGYTVLNVLEYIYEHYDAGLAFRSGCLGKGSGRCGVCPVMVNSTPALSCQRMAEKGMIVEPHPKFQIIKDLAVDFNRTKEDRHKKSETVEITVDLRKCTGCGDCIYICPVGVYALKKMNGKNKAVPVDIASCCSVSCQMCTTHCSYNAITVRPRE